MAEYIYDNLTEEPNLDYLNDLIEKSTIITKTLSGINLEYSDTYKLTIMFDEDITDDEKTELDNLVNQSLGFVPPLKDADVILKEIYDNATSQDQVTRLLTTFNKYPVINAFLEQYNYDGAWLHLNQAKDDGILTDDDITYLQQYIPTGDW